MATTCIAPISITLVAPTIINSLSKITSPLSTRAKPHCSKPLRCVSIDQVPKTEVVDEAGIMCEPCNGKGWLLCDFCKGQKTNVKADNRRTYRRCPSCRAVGYVLCSNCKVFKCVTFPNYNDGDELSF